MDIFQIQTARTNLNQISNKLKVAGLVAITVALQVPVLIGHAAENAQCKLLGIEND